MKTAFAVAALLASSPVAAQPLRLRADALTAAEAPIGVLNLEADADLVPWLHAEAVVWVGASGEGAPSGNDLPGAGDTLRGDALIIDVEARAADGRSAARLGRMVAMIGALRPLHFDGLAARTSLPKRLQLEAFAGSPVVPRTIDREFDWLVGGRVSRRIGDFGSAGVAYLHQRDRGAMATEELALDAGAALNPRTDAAARLALDLIRFGVAEAQVSATMRRASWRGEVYLSQRNASHLLPATSLFSVLGDLGAQRAGAVVNWRAAPRLDVTAERGGRRSGEDLDVEAVVRSRLFLGDRRAFRQRARSPRGPRSDGSRREGANPPMPSEIGSIGVELHRTGAVPGGWTGGRAAARWPLFGALTAAAEVELVVPDDRSHGSVWPWALGAVSWRRERWDAAVAIEASASPELSNRVDILARLTRRWEGL